MTDLAVSKGTTEHVQLETHQVRNSSPSATRNTNLFTHALGLMGTVTWLDVEQGAFEITCRSGEKFDIKVGRETSYRCLQNLDGADRDRVPTPAGYDRTDPIQQVKKYIRLGRLVSVYGILQEEGGKKSFNARIVHLLQRMDGGYFFEETHWWLFQINSLADTWLENLFGDKQTYDLDDYALYRTNLGITGKPMDENIQECATLSRLIYGLATSYLLTGCERHYLAAKSGVKYQRENFRHPSHDGKYIFWHFGKRKFDVGLDKLIVTSETRDDLGTVPLYEQIYALAGLTQYYRITRDWETLEDIRATIATFNRFYMDDTAFGGFFSHLDYASLSCSADVLGENKSKKNWNSVGDHIPAYLINLILSLDEETALHKECEELLLNLADLIVKHFPDKDPSVPFVQERFLRDWTPDRTWRWQQDRAVVGHNLKIAWNLTRIAYYIQSTGQDASKLLQLATRLGKDMAKVGVDQYRSGLYDVLERSPKNGMTLEFPWMNTKDFWQQEQAILAYLILYGATEDQEFLEIAREQAAFWNLFFLDRDRGGYYFRVTEDGLPCVIGNDGNKGGHAISGYHAFELNYLAHIYTRTFVRKEPFCLYFKPDSASRPDSIYVLPDFMPPDQVKLTRVTIDGQEYVIENPDSFEVKLDQHQWDSEIVVEISPLK